MSNRRHSTNSIQGSVRAVLTGIALAVGSAMPAVATAPPFVTQADIPAVLNVPNATYILRQNVVSTGGGPAVKVTAPGVRFYLAGYTIDGVGAGEFGIDVAGVSHVSIVGPGTVRNFRKDGVSLLSGTTRSTVQGLTVTGNGFNGDKEGIILYDGANYNSIVGNNSSYNGGEGIEIRKNANRNNVVNNTCNGNDYGGILVGYHGSGSSNRNRFSGNTTNGNTYEGIRLKEADQNQVLRHTSNGNGDGGIVVDSGSTQNRLIWNRTGGNSSPFYDLYEGNAAPVNLWIWNTGTRNGPGAANIN